MTEHVFVSRVRDILCDNAANRFVGGQKSGVIDDARIGLAPTGTGRVFKRPLARRFARYHVTLLLDASGSMLHNHRVDPCLNMAERLAASLKRSGAHVSAFAFNRITRPLAVERLRDEYEDVLGATSETLGGNRDLATGNHDPYAIDQAAKALLADASHPGKILIVLSDGRPGCDDWKECTAPGCLPHQNLAAFPPLLSKLERSGIVTLAIGICCDYVKNVYGVNRSAVCHDMAALYPAVANLLERYIQRG